MNKSAIPGTDVILFDEIADREQMILMNITDKRSQLESIQLLPKQQPTSVHELQDTDDKAMKKAFKGMTRGKFQNILQNEYASIHSDTNLILQAALFSIPFE